MRYSKDYSHHGFDAGDIRRTTTTPPLLISSSTASCCHRYTRRRCLIINIQENCQSTKLYMSGTASPFQYNPDLLAACALDGAATNACEKLFNLHAQHFGYAHLMHDET